MSKRTRFVVVGQTKPPVVVSRPVSTSTISPVTRESKVLWTLGIGLMVFLLLYVVHAIQVNQWAEQARREYELKYTSVTTIPSFQTITLKQIQNGDGWVVMRSKPDMKADVKSGPEDGRGSTVQVLQQSADGLWIQIRTAYGDEGWIPTSDIHAVLQAVQTASPSLDSTPDGPVLWGTILQSTWVYERDGDGYFLRPTSVTIDKKERVQVIEISADGSMVQVKTNKGLIGWVNRPMMTIDEVVSEGENPIPTQKSTLAEKLSPEPTASG